MRQMKFIYGFAISLSVISVAGCGSSVAGTSDAVVLPTVGTTVQPTGGTARITEPSVFVVSDSVDSTGRNAVVVFPQAATGPSLPTLTITGSQVSVDDAGDVYVFGGSGYSIDEYPAAALTGNPSRSLPVGPGTKIPEVFDVMASATGEIFVSDGTGVAVFSATATGNADPVRYITGTTQADGAIVPGLIAVDRSDNLYVENFADDSVSVFGPTATGTAVPVRTITGPLTRLTGAGIESMATDTAGNLYVLCLCESEVLSGAVSFEVLEFGPTANGNVAPIRYVTTHAMYPYFFNDAVAVDSAGTIYVSAGATTGIPTVFEFDTSASGDAVPSNTVTLGGWEDPPTSRIAVH